MTGTGAARILDAAIAVAANAPAKRGKYVGAAQVRWSIIEELREALDEYGIVWRGVDASSTTRNLDA